MALRATLQNICLEVTGKPWSVMLSNAEVWVQTKWANNFEKEHIYIYILPGVAYWHPCRFHQKFWIIICRNMYCTECLSLQCLFIHFFSDITSVKSCIILFDIVSPSQFNSISEVFVWIILSTGTMFFPLSCPIKSYSRKY